MEVLLKRKNRLLRDPVYREQASGWIHVIAAFCTLFAIFVLGYYSEKKTDFSFYWSNAAFMSSMLVVYSASAIYHILPHHKEWKQIFRRIDQGMIYLLIAGTYTPMLVVTLKDYGGMDLVIVIWILAGIGCILKLANTNFSDIVQTFIYIALGATGIFKIYTYSELFQPDAMYWFKWGVLAYLIGAGIYIAEAKWDPQSKGWYHEVFHIFVMIGCGCHYVMVLKYL